MAHTLDLLRQEHREMRVLLDALEQQLDLFEQAGEPDFELLSEIVDYFRGVPDLYHHPKEDLIYYYMSLRVTEENELRVDLHAEHDRGSDLLNIFARHLMRVLLGVELPRDLVVKTGRAFLENEKRHMDAEEKSFFPAAQQFLTQEDWSQVDERVMRRRDPRLEEQAQHRFRLVRALLN